MNNQVDSQKVTQPSESVELVIANKSDGLRIMMEARVKVLRDERENFLLRANQQIAGYNIAIAEMETLLNPPKPGPEIGQVKEAESGTPSPSNKVVAKRNRHKPKSKGALNGSAAVPTSEAPF
jgi:hypothetical protein